MAVDIAELRGVVERFVASAAEPAVLDSGEEPLRLIPDHWSLTEWNGRLTLQAWDSRRNLVRKVTGLGVQRRDRIGLLVERFPKAAGELQIVDLGAPLGRELERKGSRAAFRERIEAKGHAVENVRGAVAGAAPAEATVARPVVD
mgnify:CR=1 FL=1